VVSLVIRPRNDADLDALVAILQESHRTDGYPPMAEHVTANWLTEKGDPAWVADLDGVLVGHNTSAIRLYERRGWVRTASERTDWFGVDGPSLLLHHYRKR
jgi:hypothetical protein